MTKDVFNQLKDFGWENFDFQVNRSFYQLKEDKKRKYIIAEHNCELFLCNWNKGDWAIDYCALSLGDLLLFTRVARNIITIENSPKSFTLEDYNNAKAELKRLCKKKKTRYFSV